MDLWSNHLHVVVLPLVTFHCWKGQHSRDVIEECTSTVHTTPLPPVQAWASPLTLLWTRTPELDMSGVSQLFPAPHTTAQPPLIMTTLGSSFPYAGWKDALSAGFLVRRKQGTRPSSCLPELCPSILHSLPGPA